MKFTHYNLGFLDKDQIVEIGLKGNATNVFLMQSTQFAHYKKTGERHGVGGLFQHTPVRLRVPHSGYWLLTLDFGGFTGKVDSHVDVYPANYFNQIATK